MWYNNVNTKHKHEIDWEAVDAAPESECNYDDAPEATLEFFKTARIRMPHTSKPVTMRIKQDTLAFFKKKTAHYQTLMNSVLDAYVAAHAKKLAH